MRGSACGGRFSGRALPRYPGYGRKRTDRDRCARLECHDPHYKDVTARSGNRADCEGSSRSPSTSLGRPVYRGRCCCMDIRQQGNQSDKGREEQPRYQYRSFRPLALAQTTKKIGLLMSARLCPCDSPSDCQSVTRSQGVWTELTFRVDYRVAARMQLGLEACDLDAAVGLCRREGV